MNSSNQTQISNLLLDENIKNMVESMNGVFPESLNKNIVKQGLFKLNKARFESLNSLSTVDFPPIKITQMNRVYDGRHRLSVAIFRGQKTIPSKMI